MAFKIEAHELEITNLKARVKLLEDKEEGGIAEQSGDDASIKGRSLDEGEKAAEKGSNDTEEMVNVLTSLDAATVLTNGGGDDPSREDAIIKRRSLETREEAGIERSMDKGNNDTEEMVNVLTSLDAASILTSGVQVSVPPAAEVPL
nr:hypothetical protein [Tanacetum cinerariifolium]